MDEIINGTYKLAESNNFDEYMKKIGVGFGKRKIANNTSPTIEVVKKGDDFEIKTITSFKNYQQNFTLGVKFEETSMDDIQVKCTCTLDGGILKQIQERPDGETEIIREFTAEGLKATFTSGGVVATRFYKRV